MRKTNFLCHEWFRTLQVCRNRLQKVEYSPCFFLVTSITPAYLSHPSQTPVSCTSSLLHESTNVSMHSGHLCEPLVQNVGMDTMRLEINDDFSQHCSFGTILLLPSFYWKVFQLVPWCISSIRVTWNVKKDRDMYVSLSLWGDLKDQRGWKKNKRRGGPWE